MRIRRAALLAAAALAYLPGQAKAFTIRDFHVCSTGSFSACASVQVWTVPRSGGGTDIFMKVANLSGYRLTSLHLGFGQKFGGFSVGGWSAEGGAPVQGSPQFRYGVEPGQITVTAEQFYSSKFSPTGIVGCSIPTDYARGIQTCDGGYVLFRFSDLGTLGLPGRIGVGFATNLTYDQCGIAGGSSPDPRCDFTYRDYDSTAVPEPVTLLLLGSGLAGMGGVSLVRRRRKPADVR